MANAASCVYQLGATQLKQILLGCLTYLKKKKQQLYSLKSLKTKRAGLLLKMNGSSKLWDLDTDENDENLEIPGKGDNA